MKKRTRQEKVENPRLIVYSNKFTNEIFICRENNEQEHFEKHLNVTKSNTDDFERHVFDHCVHLVPNFRMMLT